MRIVSNGVQPYIVQTGVDTDGETQEEVTTFRMKLDVSEWRSFLHPASRRVTLSGAARDTTIDFISLSLAPPPSPSLLLSFSSSAAERRGCCCCIVRREKKR
ncbi:hypothetical protein DPX16_5815 [Anabarilius grahami]|uniref:Uncharacterized protein n=1 Tax=Anabarilius grahami TaxID=495550 RepID=A0A3N0YV20_ANAGA|nr:hypothetical protein DPX16_5815 [Anabarilius grahami]